MYENDPQRLANARASVRSDHPVTNWTVAQAERLALQALGLMDAAGVPLPLGALEDLVAIGVPAQAPNQVRMFQLRGVIHELVHGLDFRDLVQLTPGDHDAALRTQEAELGFWQNPAGYARNEIVTDHRTEVVLDRNGLLFPELRQSFDTYRAYWEAQSPLSEPVFALLTARLNRTRYP